MKGKIKQHFHKALSIVCASLIGILTVAYSVSIPAYADHVGGYYEIHTINAINYLSSLSGISSYELFQGYDWQEYPDVMFVTATGKHNDIKYDFWYDENHEIQYTMWSGSDIVASSVESDNQENSGSSSGSAGTITASDLKTIYSDYAYRYAPAPNVDEYKWSYQSEYANARAISMDSNGFYPFSPIAPVYTYTRGTWGNKLWSSVYVLLFLQDDNKGTYYCEHYVHIYSTRNDEGSALLNIDFYNLSDNTLYKSYSQAWNADRPYISIDYNYSLLSYTSHSNFLGNSDFIFTFYAPNMSGLSRGNLYTGDLDNKIAYNKADGTFNPSTTPADDWGFMLSSHPFELYANQSSIDFDQIPDNYVITISGDTIYNYPITNPDTGDTSTINYYITNNYTLPENPSDDPVDNGGSSGGSTSGNVNVSGEVVVGGQIDIKTDPIDININVNNGNSGETSSGDPYVNGEDVNLTEYLEHVPEISKGFTDYLKDFFVWLPPEIYGLIILALVVCIWCRLAGR